MPRIRKFVAYRKLERPYTRVSKFKKKSYIKTTPNIKIVSFDMGSPQKKFQYTLRLKSKSSLQIRDNAIESARESSNRLLERTIGLSSYHMKIHAYPFHILRENPLATGAGADRFSTGMQKSFGKPIGSAAQIREGKTLFSLSVDKANIELARKALKRVASKLPCHCAIEITENKYSKEHK